MSGDKYTRCAECRKTDAAKSVQRVAERKARGLCRCGKAKPVAGKATCKKCRARRKARESEADV